MAYLDHTQECILEQKARDYSRYVIDREPPREMIERYINANSKLGTDVVTSFDTKIMSFSWTYPRSVPLLDAAADFLQPDALLRKKIYVMAAVLEASPRYTKHFLPQKLSPLKLFVNVWTLK